MSVEQLKLAFSYPLEGTPKPVLICLAWHAAEDGSGARPSVATIAREIGFSVRAVRDALRELERAQLIIAEVRQVGKPSSYRLSNLRQQAPRQQPPKANGAVATPAGGAVTPAGGAETTAAAAANRSERLERPPDARASDPDGLALTGSGNGTGTIPPPVTFTAEQRAAAVAADKAAAKAAARSAANLLAKPPASRPPQDRTAINAALAEIQARRRTADVPRETAERCIPTDTAKVTAEGVAISATPTLSRTPNGNAVPDSGDGSRANLAKV